MQAADDQIEVNTRVYARYTVLTTRDMLCECKRCQLQSDAGEPSVNSVCLEVLKQHDQVIELIKPTLESIRRFLPCLNACLLYIGDRFTCIYLIQNWFRLIRLHFESHTKIAP